MIRRLIVGYCYDIRSERWWCEVAHLKLTYRWHARMPPVQEWILMGPRS